jgi:HEAT repeat protein
LEALLAQPVTQHPDWVALLSSSEPIVAANAAIVLARSGDPAAIRPLLRAINTAQMNLRQRQAAIEALADIGRPETGNPDVVGELRRLVDTYGDFSGPAQSRYVAELHAESLRSLAWSEATLAPALEPRFEAAMASASPLVRREALLALAEARFGELPRSALRAANDVDPRVRQAALAVLAARHHPTGQDAIRRALMDQELSVRLAAVAALGRLGGPESQTELRRLATKEGELIRAAAIESLVKLHDQPTVTAAAADKSWHVRLVVARTLSRDANPSARELALQLVADVNTDVAQAAIHVVGGWPLPEAGPILLAAMEGKAFLPRKGATEQLGSLWPPAANFEFEAAPDHRAAAMADLRRKWREQFGASEFPGTTAAGPSSPPLAVSPDQAQEMAAWVDQLAVPATTSAQRRATLKSLVDVGTELPAILERWHEQTARPLPDAVYREVLSRVSPEFAAIEQMNTADTPQRRQAIDAVRTITNQHSLSALALERFAGLAAHENDPLAWAGILSALADDGREPAIRLAYAALGHPAPDVRRRACDFLAAHPEPRHGPLLTLSLTDPIPTVVGAAVRALGQLQSLDDSRALEQLLAATDHELRVDVAESLTRLRKPAGGAALERLTHDPDPRVRRRAAVAMGQVPDESFLPALIALLDDRPEIRRAALASLPLVAGKQPPVADQNTAAPADGPASEAMRWKQWYRSQVTLR